MDTVCAGDKNDDDLVHVHSILYVYHHIHIVVKINYIVTIL